MSPSSSRLTQKFQVTIPRAIRQTLGLKQGDTVRFELRNGEAFLRKETPLDIAFLQTLEGNLGEWQSDADEDAYRGL